MRTILTSIVLLSAMTALVTAQRAPASDAPAAAPKAEAVSFIGHLCGRLASDDARLRFAAREALVVMGNQAVPALKEASGGQKDPHVQAFIKRTLSRIKKLSGKKRGRWIAPGRDLDRMAMQTNLTLEQVTKLEPLFAKHDKDVKALWAEFRESEGFKDPGGYKDLMAEVKLLADEASPELSKFLDDKQRKYVTQQMRRATPFGGGGAVSFVGAEGGGGAVILGGPGGGMRVRKAPEK